MVYRLTKSIELLESCDTPTGPVSSRDILSKSSDVLVHAT